MKPLTVYKASAGSGKTFTLAVEYIKLLIKNPLSFRNILAVTFTNKATEEMKLRILSQLYGIWKMLPDSKVYMQEITGKLNISEKQASGQAGTALRCLIHNYNYFRVETIDSFFQSILRNLARELDLTANLRIGLNDVQVEEQAVDRLIESLSTTSVMLKWLISYIFSNINENKSWNVIGQIKSFGRTIFHDYYKVIGEDLNTIVSGQNFFENYTRQLKTVRENAEKKMAGYADIFEKETAAAGLSTTSYNRGKSGICSYFNKLKSNDFSDARCVNATLRKCLEDANSWASKSSLDRTTILSVVNSRLMQLLHDAERERQKMWRLHSSVDATLRHLSKLRLLNSIETKVRELNEEANRFLLSDTQYLLHTLIKDNDSPFIFEKAGCHLEHIMIDEFQDTSSIQWQNFKVLLKECMSHGYEEEDTVRNLIVGDVKQSIYRWRSGDWRLLNNIDRQFSPPEKNVEIRSLQTNYRSERNIIEFNNLFFTTALKYEYEQELEINSKETADELQSAYGDVCQTAGKEKENNGLVRITLIPDEDYDNDMLEKVEDSVDELLHSGVALSNIAVLIRYNKHIPLIANYFMKKRPELKTVSDEAFRLDASLAVNTIIQALYLLLNPEDILTKATLTVTYQKKILCSSLSDSDLLTETVNEPGKLDAMLPESFINQMKELQKKPLFDTIEHIYSSFELSKLKNQSAYICAFYDQVAEFVNNNSVNVRKFINEWNESIHTKTIQSDEINGIRLISIHKSKGLEFDHVIIPFCDWTLENKNTTLWCNPKEKPFNSLPIVPVDYSKKLLETIYADDYRNEHIQNTVDNLNLLYVAFTRASKNLFVIGKRSNNGKVQSRSEIIYKCLPEINETLINSTLTGIDEEMDDIVFEYGTLAADDKKEKRESDNVFLRPSKQYNVNTDITGIAVEFRQSNKSRDFITNNDSDKEKGMYIKTGNILHKLFSMIHSTEDVDNILKQFEFDGILYDDSITADKMRSLLSKRLSDKRIADWFDSRWNVFNECSILFFDKEKNKVIERRPDRVITDGNEMKVIDFKFGKPCEEYKEQVRQYMKLLESMGNKNIEGYLWFVYSNKIEKVELTENNKINNNTI